MNDYLKEVQEDVNDMNKTFTMGAGQSTEAPGTESPGTEAPGTESPNTEAPGTEVPGTDAPNTEAPGTDAPTTETPTTEAPDDKDEIIEDLRRQLDEKSGTPKTDAPKTETPTTEAPISFEDRDFLKDYDLEDMRDNPEKFNKFLNNFYQTTISDARKILGEGVLRAIPGIVKNDVALNIKMQKMNEDFYSDNKDLVPFKRVVAEVFEDLAAKNPDKKYDEVLKDVAPKVRKVLNLQKATHKKDDNKPPRLPRKKGNSPKPKNKPNVSGIESEISDMNEILRR